MSVRLVKSEFCQFGLHDPDNSAKSVPRLIGSAVKNLCDSCFTLFNKGRSGGWDFTMKIIHYWAEELGPVPKLPNSISNPLNRAKLSHCLNEIINTVCMTLLIKKAISLLGYGLDVWTVQKQHANTICSKVKKLN